MTDFPVRSVKGFLRQIAEDARCANRLVRGFVRYSRSGITPDDAHHSMIRLYCRTNGRSNDFWHALARRRYPAARLSHADGVLGRLSKNDADKIAAQIREQGYARPNQRLPADICQRLTEFALRNESLTNPPCLGRPARAVYDPVRPIAASYKFEESALGKQPEIQSLIADTSNVRSIVNGCL